MVKDPPREGHVWWHILPRDDPEPGIQKMLRNLVSILVPVYKSSHDADEY